MSSSTEDSLISRWKADDLRSLWLHQIERGDDGRVVSFWSRSERHLSPVSQHVYLRQALTLADLLAESGVRPGAPAVIDCAAPRSTLLAYVATVLSGGVPLITPVHLASKALTSDRAGELAASVGATCVVTDRTRPPHEPERPSLPIPARVRIDPLGIEAARAIPSSVAPAGQPSEVVHLQLTSGSTASPKATAVTHGNVLANCGALSQMREMSSEDAIVSWLPLYHDMGLVGMALLSLLQGTDLHLLSPFDFLSHPGDWLSSISTTGAAVTSSPTFGYRLAAIRTSDAEREGLDLSRLRVACCGGEPVRADVLSMFTQRFAPCGLREGVLLPCYGLAEATLTVTFGVLHQRPSLIRISGSALSANGQVMLTEAGRLGDLTLPSKSTSGRKAVVESPRSSTDSTQLLVSAGIAVADTEVCIVDPDTGEPRPTEDLCGEVAVRGPGVTPGVWRGGHIEPRSGVWLRTGDIGLIHRGELYLIERSNNMLIRNGQNYPAIALETGLAAASEVDVDGVMVVDRDIHDPDSRLTGVIEADRGVDPEKLADRAATAGALLELPLDDVLVIRRGGLPRTSSGKKKHASLRQALRDHTLPVIAQRGATLASDPSERALIDLTNQDRILDLRTAATSPDIADSVIDEVRRACADRGTSRLVTLNASFRQDLDLDSLALFELAVAVEERTGGSIDHELLATVQSVDDLVQAVKEGDEQSSRLSALHDSFLSSIPQLNVLVDRQEGRSLTVGSRNVADFASCNYLGLDLHPSVMDAISPMVQEWGVHPSWTRAVASPEPYLRLEQRLAQLVGAADTVVFPTISLLHLGVLPTLAGPRGAILVDEYAHHSIREAAELARSRGSEVVSFRHGNLEDLSAKLRSSESRSTRVIAIDGVYSMSGAHPELAALLTVAETWNATLYIDDAHGFGVLGENPTISVPYGRRGNGVHNYLNAPLDRITYVAGLSKAYSSMGAFVTCNGPQDRLRLLTASTLIFSGPVPTASLASALAGLEVNEREGDAIRLRLRDLTTSLAEGIRDLDLQVSNSNGFPILTVQFGSPDTVLRACRALWDHGILITPTVFPAVPMRQGGVRFSVTAANTERDIERALTALAAARNAAGLDLSDSPLKSLR